MTIFTSKYIPGKKRNSSSQKCARKRILKLTGAICGECSWQPPIGREPLLYLHHIKPLFEGGTHDNSNLVLLCDPCHKQAHRELRERGDN